MQALVWSGKDQLEVRDVPEPEPGEGEALVRVSHVGICGTDLHIWHGTHPRAKPPLIMGHEFSGAIEALGPGVEGFRVGDPVAPYPVLECGQCDLCAAGDGHLCGSLGLIGIDRDGAMASLVAVPARKLHRVPGHVDLKLAALMEPAAVGVHSTGKSRVHEAKTVALIGAGPIGLSVAIAARARGAGEIFVADVTDYRCRVARELGFHAVNVARDSLLDAVLDATEGKGADVVFECTGIVQAAKGLTKLPRIGGQIVIVGIFGELCPVDLRDVSFKELDVIGVRHYYPAEFDEAIRLVARGKLDVAPLISDVYPISQGKAAFERLQAGQDAIKVLLKPK